MMGYSPYFDFIWITVIYWVVLSTSLLQFEIVYTEQFSAIPESHAAYELRVVNIYARNPNEMFYAHTGNNIRCYPSHSADIRP